MPQRATSVRVARVERKDELEDRCREEQEHGGRAWIDRNALELVSSLCHLSSWAHKASRVAASKGTLAMRRGRHASC